MSWRATLVFLTFLAASSAAQAVEITTYGSGLLPCSTYLDARAREQSADQVTFVHWLVGYFSGVNATSTRRNNLLGLSDVKEAMYRLDGLCRARPGTHFADAVNSMMIGASSKPGAHSVELTQYGSGFKPCRSYVEAREPQNLDGDEFVDWLGGYLSGVNAISLKTNDILGTTEFVQAVYWLDDYCSSHPVEPFSRAVSALVDTGYRTLVDTGHRSR